MAERRVVSQRRARAVVVIVIVAGAKNVADVGGIAGVVAMSRRDVAASVRMRRVRKRRRRSIVQSRAGWIRRKL